MFSNQPTTIYNRIGKIGTYVRAAAELRFPTFFTREILHTTAVQSLEDIAAGRAGSGTKEDPFHYVPHGSFAVDVAVPAAVASEDEVAYLGWLELRAKRNY